MPAARAGGDGEQNEGDALCRGDNGLQSARGRPARNLLYAAQQRRKVTDLFRARRAKLRHGEKQNRKIQRLHRFC